MVTHSRISIRDLNDRLRLFGQLDGNLLAVEQAVGVTIQTDDEDLIVSGTSEDVAVGVAALRRLVDAAKAGADLTPEDARDAVEAVRAPDQRESGDQNEMPAKRADNGSRQEAGAERGRDRVVGESLATTRRGRPVRARSAGQRSFVEAMAHNTLTFAIGPAGTGKTFLAVVMALAALRAGDVARIVLSRPAVEAGENLGFLPGDMQQKVDPYLRPLFDAVGEIMEQSAVARAVERGQIEVAPLAYMRGRTLSDSFIVLDEGQNTSREQMKMFLTRIGANSRMVVCGDITQIDLVRPQDSGLVHATRVFANSDDIAVVTLGEADVVRHPLIRQIIRSYERYDS